MQDVLGSHAAAPDVHRAVVELVAEVAAPSARDDEELVAPVTHIYLISCPRGQGRARPDLMSLLYPRTYAW